MATKKASKKATKKKAQKKKTKVAAPCQDLQINTDGTINRLTVKHGECVRILTPPGFTVDMKVTNTLTAGSGGPVIIHS